MIGIIYKFTILASIKRDNSKPFYVGQHWEKGGLKHFLSSSVSNYPGSGTIWEELYLLLKRKFPTCWRKLIKREVLFYSENCSQKALDKMEEYYIKKEKSHYSYEVGGCNILWGTANKFGSGSPMKDPNIAAKVTKQLRGRKGARRSEEGKLNMSISAKKSWENAKKRRETISKAISSYMKNGGREHLSRVKKGRKFSEEHRRNIALNHADISGKNHPCYGKHFKWITNGSVEQRLDEGKLLPEGFQYGRIKYKK